MPTVAKGMAGVAARPTVEIAPGATTILVVDDIESNRDYLVTLLRHHGYRLVQAVDGRDGLAIVKAEHPDLVISDVLMPVMDGYEFVRQLRLDPETSRIPVVFYTAHYGEREAQSLAMSSGVAHVLTKPVTSSEVLEVVSRVLSAKADAGSLPQVSPLSNEFDQKHVRLLTDKLSEKVSDLITANSQLRSLINIEVELASDQDSTRRIEKVCESARDLFGATYVTIGILDRTNGTLLRLVSCGADTSSWIESGGCAPGILGRAVAERRTFRGNNPGGDPARLGLPSHHPNARGFLIGPLATASHVYGWICLVGNEGNGFTEDDEHLAMVLAGQVGRAYELEYEILERKQAELALPHERDRAQRYLDTAEVILLALDVDGRITLTNRYACSVLGWTAEELIGRDWVATCVPARRRADLAHKFHDLLDGDLSIVESLILTRSGDERLIEWRNTVQRDSTGKVVGTFSSGSDVTERSRAQAALGQLAAIVDSSDDAIFSTGLDETILTWNAGAERLYGYTAREMIGRNRSTIVPAGKRDELTAVLAQAARGESSAPFESQRTRKDGSSVEISLVISPMKDPTGQVIGASTISRDVTSRKKGEADLKRAEERMRFTLEAAGVGIWELDFATGVLQWSEILEAQHGLRPGTFAGTLQAFLEHIHPDDRESIRNTMQVHGAGGDFSMQYRTVWPDGMIRWLNGVGRVHLGALGEPARAIGISLDVTEGRKLEEQYQQAQKMDAIGRLAGGVAHDFNNLLTVILGNCELILGDLDSSDPDHSSLVEIQKAGTSAAGLTRQLLAFSRKQLIEPTVLDLNAVLVHLRTMLGRLIGEDVKVLYGLHSELPLVKADRSQMEQLVVNLAVNARDAMPKGGTLTIETAIVELDDAYASTHLSVEPGSYVALTVSDTGTGMTPEVQARLFEPFFTTKEVGKGTGLGLATVHGIVTGNGGSVNVYSEVGKGTSFTVYFPRANAAEMAVDAPQTIARARTGPETVLVVEDAVGLRELTKRLLERLGYTVIVAANADEALIEFSRNPGIDVLLTDVVMPGASGPDLTRQLVEQRPALKVIYMSGYTGEAIIHHGVINPGIAFLHKPFTSAALGRKIREVLDR